MTSQVQVGVGEAAEVFKVCSQDTVPQRRWASRSVTFQFRVVVEGWAVEVFKFFSPGQISTALESMQIAEQSSRASSSSSRTAEGAFDWFFRTFPRVKTSAGSASQCGDHQPGYFLPDGVVAHSSSWSPVAYGHSTLPVEDDGQEDFFQDGDEGEEERRARDVRRVY